MSDLITSQMLSDWRANYGLDKRTPIKAMHWWQDNMDGKAPAGVVAALGLCINEIERLTAALKKANDQAEHFERHWYLRGDEIADLRTMLGVECDSADMIARERDELRRQLAEAEQDARRFDWLAERLEDVQIDDANPLDHYYGDEEDVPYPVLWRRAIDDAMGVSDE